MGTGTDVAMSSAQVTLVRATCAASCTRARFPAHGGQHEAEPGFAFRYNALGVPIAAGVLYPVLACCSVPMIAALAMSLSSVSVVTNALRLGRSSLAPAQVLAPAPVRTAS
jgi:Cu+-exporting ATPase